MGKEDMWMLPASQAGLSLVSEGINYFQGRDLKKRGRSMERGLTKAEYEIPEYIGDNYKLAKRMANEGISAEDENAFKDDLLSSTANSIRQFRGRKAGIVGAEVLGQQTKDSLRKFRIADSRQKIENQREYMKQGQIMADYEDKAFQLNQLDPYADKLNYARSLQSAGNQNMNNALSNFTQSLSSAGSGYFQSLY